jgi:pimeloyl-ACP methyl ester carboxylesterase
MRKIILHSLVFLLCFQASAQSITAYKYWFDANVGSAVTVNDAFGSNFDLNIPVSTTSLTDGLHTFNICFQQSNGLWSAVISSFFYKNGVVSSGNTNQYKTWFDNDFAHAITTTVTPSNDLDLQANIDVSMLSNGLHTFNIAFQDANNLWSAVTSSFFYKNTVSGSNTITQYQTWFDNNFANVLTKTITTPTTNTDIQTNLDVSSLSTGLHVLHTRYQTSGGLWSSATSDFFIKENNVASNKLVKYRYWFDANIQNAKEITLSGSTVYDLQNNIDCEALTLGKHLLSIQVKDLKGLWSTVVADSISRVTMGVKNFIEPKVLTNKGTLNVGDTQVITGKDFTPNGKIKLSIINELGENLADSTQINYTDGGKFTYNLPITNAARNGEYTASAADISTGKVSPSIKFKVNNAVTRTLWITKPSLGDTYVINQDISIQWGAFIEKTASIGKSGLVQKKYKIELSNNNGSTWTVLKNEQIFNNAVSGTNNNNFSTSFRIASVGSTYKIRITDVENPTDVKISETFSVVTKLVSGFDYALEWDKSSPLPSGQPHPIGLAADGTSRIFVKLSKAIGNNKTVTKIQGAISSVEGFVGTDLLGKIMYATNHDTYNEEANTATLSNITKTVTDVPEYWFWLVAPDDFTHEQNSELDHRKITADFTVTYTDNSTENVSTTLEIVRPPLFMVHGLNGSSESFKNFKYDVGNGEKIFDGDGKGGTYKNPTWKEAQRLNLYNYESFARNAEVILGINIQGDNYYNTFGAFLKAMHKRGFASNKVDYVAHSMGGSIARTMINLYVDSYKPSVGSMAIYKNYSKGFINKLVTIDTPHNGSPWADLLKSVFGNGLDNSTLYSLRRMGLLKGFFVPNGTQSGVPLFELSPAINDLQAHKGGIRFNKTTVKNHLIGGDIDRYNVPDAFLLTALNSKIETKALLGVATLAFPTAILKLDGKIDAVNAYMSIRYGYSNFISSSDGIVHLSSQFPNSSNINAIPEVENVNAVSAATNSYGFERNHVQITDDLAVGTKVMRLLNSPINSNYFADEIVANPNPNGNHTYSQETSISSSDSIKTHFDKGHIEIISPSTQSITYIDSTIQVQINLKDTTHLKGIQIAFQSEFYDSYSKIANQTFNFKVHSNAIGKNIVFAEATYDSLGFTVNHIDTITVNVKANSALRDFYATPKTVFLNPKQTFTPTFNVVYDSFVGQLNSDTDSLSFTIADTNVVRYDKITAQFIAKDSSSTYITFSYKGFTDKVLIVLTLPEEVSCSESSIFESLKTGTWDDTTVWSCGTLPTITNPVRINFGNIITIPLNYTGFLQTLILNGRLNYGVGSKLKYGN